METTKTTEQISNEAFTASKNAITAAEFLAAAEMHAAAMETGNSAMKGGHSFAANTCKLKAQRAAAKAAGSMSRVERINSGLNYSAQIGR